MWNVMIFIASNLLNLTYLSLCICNILNTDLDNEWNFVFTKWTLYNVIFFPFCRNCFSSNINSTSQCINENHLTPNYPLFLVSSEINQQWQCVNYHCFFQKQYGLKILRWRYKAAPAWPRIHKCSRRETCHFRIWPETSHEVWGKKETGRQKAERYWEKQPGTEAISTTSTCKKCLLRRHRIYGVWFKVQHTNKFLNIQEYYK